MRDSKNLTRRDVLKGGAASAALALPILKFAPPSPAVECAGLWCVNHDAPGHHTTVIVRQWASDPYGVCKLCPLAECNPHDRVCVVDAQCHVRPEDAGAFSIVESRKAKGGAR